MNVYEVGGCVRDRCLGLIPHDRDYVVVGSAPEELLSQGYVPVGKDFPVFLHPETKEEYALARTERKTGHGGFTVHASPDVTLEEDLKRRDLTINAMAWDVSTQTLVDPLGGQKDLEERWLRHASEAFVEDPLRVLRVARFASRYHGLGFKVAPETLGLMKQLVASGELDHLTPERVFQEVKKAFSGPDPHVFIQVLKESGALEVLLPEVMALYGVPQPALHHPEIDTGIHNELVMQQASILSNQDPMVVFAAMVHDLGKGITPKEEWPQHRDHESTGVPLVEAVCRRWKVPKEWEQLAVHVCALHLHVHRGQEVRPKTMFKVMETVQALKHPVRWEQFLIACEADARGRTGLEDRDYPQREWFEGALTEAKKISSAPYLEKGLQGPELGEAIRRGRIGAIATYLREHRAPWLAQKKQASHAETKHSKPSPGV